MAESNRREFAVAALLVVPLLFAAVWLGIHHWRRPDPAAGSKRNPVAAPRPPDTGDWTGVGSWPTYHGDFALTGVAPDRFPRRPVRVWRTRVGNLLPSNIVAADGRLFCVADEETVVALNRKGEKLWTKTFTATAASDAGPKRLESIIAPPLVIGSELLVVATEAGNVYGLSPADGRRKWTFPTGLPIQGSPNYLPAGGDQPERIVVITQDDGIVFAVNAATGRQLWKSAKLERTDGHPAAANGVIVLANCASAFFQLDGATGREKEGTVRLDEGCEMAGGVAIRDDIAFAGNRSGTFVAADLSRGQELWNDDSGEGEMFTTPAVDEEHVVFADSRGIVFCVDRRTGKQNWTYNTKRGSLRHPVIAGDLALIGAGGRLSAIKLAGGRRVWTLAISDDFTSPAIVGGLIVVGTDDGHVAAYAAGGTE